MSISRGIAHRPTIAPNWPIFRSTQIKIAEASAEDRRGPADSCARHASRRWPTQRRGYVPDIAAKTRMRRDGAYSVNLCTEAVSLLFLGERRAGLFTSGALQRQFSRRPRHQFAHCVQFDAAGTNYGRVALGLPSENLTL